MTATLNDRHPRPGGPLPCPNAPLNDCSGASAQCEGIHHGTLAKTVRKSFARRPLRRRRIPCRSRGGGLPRLPCIHCRQLALLPAVWRRGAAAGLQEMQRQPSGRRAVLRTMRPADHLTVQAGRSCAAIRGRTGNNGRFRQKHPRRPCSSTTPSPSPPSSRTARWSGATKPWKPPSDRKSVV